MSIHTTRDQRRQLARDNLKWPAALTEIPRSQWPHPDGPQLRVLRSRDFLVQEFSEEGAALVRLSINITSMDGARWKDGISWEDMQRIKAEAGYPMHDAVVVFPRAVDVVNVANMRHIWIMRYRLPPCPARRWVESARHFLTWRRVAFAVMMAVTALKLLACTG